MSLEREVMSTWMHTVCMCHTLLGTGCSSLRSLVKHVPLCTSHWLPLPHNVGGGCRNGVSWTPPNTGTSISGETPGIHPTLLNPHPARWEKLKTFHRGNWDHGPIHWKALGSFHDIPQLPAVMEGAWGLQWLVDYWNAKSKLSEYQSGQVTGTVACNNCQYHTSCNNCQYHTTVL